MNKTKNYMKKTIKSDVIFIFVISCIMFLNSGFIIKNIVTHYEKNEWDFEIRLVNKGEFQNKYCLLIDGEIYEEINYNNYSNKNSEGNSNVRISLIIQEIGSMINSIIIGTIFFISYFILRNIVKEKRPFIRRNIKFIRIVAILTMLLSIIPVAIKLCSTVIVFSNATINLSEINLFILSFGVLIGIISEIYKNGCCLQEDIDQIA